MQYIKYIYYIILFHSCFSLVFFSWREEYNKKNFFPMALLSKIENRHFQNVHFEFSNTFSFFFVDL
jgi:hypothetical protein